MGLFEIFRKRRLKLTLEQKERLSRITKFQQQKALRDALAKGEEIAEYAWTPVPEPVDCAQVYRDLQARQGAIRRRAEEAGSSLEAMIEVDPQGTAAAMDDDEKFEEIIKKVQARRNQG